MHFSMNATLTMFYDLWQKEPRGTNAHSSGAHTRRRKKVINRNDAAAICFCSGDESNQNSRPARIRKFLCIKRYNFLMRVRKKMLTRCWHKGRLEMTSAREFWERVIKGLHWHHPHGFVVDRIRRRASFPRGHQQNMRSQNLVQLPVLKTPTTKIIQSQTKMIWWKFDLVFIGSGEWFGWWIWGFWSSDAGRAWIQSPAKAAEERI